ncbi:MAG: hypothetical protein AABN95_13000 [Acidobacteriota bacterium]
MEVIIREIEAALDAGFYYLAIAITLTLPDICAALESPQGRTSGALYRDWYNAWLAPSYPAVTADDMYSLRCGLIHQGRFGQGNMQFGRILFTLPTPQRNVFHHIIMDDALNLDANRFCRDVLQAVRRWYAANQGNPVVQGNLPRLLQFYPHGLAPYIIGTPLIA